MDLGRFAEVVEFLDRHIHRRPGGQHRIGEDEHPIFQVRTGNVFDFDLERSVLMVPAIGGNEGATC